MNLRLNCGDSKTLAIALTEDGVPTAAAFTPEVGDTLIFTVKADPADADVDALIQKVTGAGITFSGSTASVEIVYEDTATLAAEVVYYDIQCQAIADGAVSTVALGRLQLVRDITREVTTSVPIYTTNPGIPGGGASVTISTTPPASPTEGDLWQDSETGIISVYDGTVWVGTDTPAVSSDVASFLGADDAAAGRSAIGAEVDRYTAFIEALTDAGLYDDLIDGVILQSPYNTVSGGTVPTINGGTATVYGSATISPTGMRMNGTSQRVEFSIAGATTGTTVIEYQSGIDSASAGGVMFGVTHASGTASGCLMQLQWAGGDNSGSGPGRVESNNAGASTYSDFTYTAWPCPGVTTRDPILRTLAFTNSGAGAVKIYMDGEINVSSTAQATLSVPSTKVCIGAKAGGSNYCAGTFRNALIFSRVLTAAELEIVQTCLRHLDPASLEYIVDGDSTSAINQYNPGYFQIATVGHLAARLSADHRVRATGVGGVTTQSLSGDLDRWGKFMNFEGVKGGTYILISGTNDISAASSAADIYGWMKTIWAAARNYGLRVGSATMPASSDFDGAEQAVRTSLNTLILSDPKLYDFCIRRDLLLPVATDTSMLYDGTHGTTAGYGRIAEAILGGVTNPDFQIRAFITYANDAAAAADTAFPSGGLYLITGSTTLHAKP